MSGITATNDPWEADAVLVNTCGFINDAKKESIDRIFDMIRLKEQKEDMILAVSGCLSQRYADELYKEMPEVDIFLGVNDYEALPGALKGSEKGERKRIFSPHPEPLRNFPQEAA